jgi:hypothetical protein
MQVGAAAWRVCGAGAAGGRLMGRGRERGALGTVALLRHALPLSPARPHALQGGRSGAGGGGVHVVAPCPHDGRCPLWQASQRRCRSPSLRPRPLRPPACATCTVTCRPPGLQAGRRGECAFEQPLVRPGFMDGVRAAVTAFSAASGRPSRPASRGASRTGQGDDGGGDAGPAGSSLVSPGRRCLVCVTAPQSPPGRGCTAGRPATTCAMPRSWRRAMPAVPHCRVARPSASATWSSAEGLGPARTRRRGLC